MKSIFFLAISGLCLFMSTHAQQDKKTYYGIKGGLNHTSINGVETDGNRTGFIGTTLYGAFFADTRISTTTFLGTEILVSWVNDWHFVEIPVHLRQILGKRFSALIGPKFDLSANRIDKSTNDRSDWLGVSTELGIRFDFSQLIFAESRYSIGVSKQFKDPFFDINDGRRNNLRFGVGFRF